MMALGVPMLGPLLGLVLGLLLALVLLDVLIHRDDLAAWLVLGVTLLDAAIRTPGLQISSARVTASDAVFALVAAAAAARLLRARRLSVGQRALVVLGALAALQLVRGVRESGPAAVNDFRSYLGFLATAAYTSLARTDLRAPGRAMRPWLWAGAGVACLVAVRWVGRFAGVPLGPLDARYDAAIRVLSGPETFFVAQLAVVALLWGLGERGRRGAARWLGLLLLLMAVVLNRRTVWLTLVVVLLVLLIRDPAVGRRLAAVGALGVVAFVLAIPHLPGAVGEDRPAAQSATSTGTFLWRLEGWEALIADGPDTPAAAAVGEPFGRGYAREVAGRDLASTPHSYYLQTFLRTGLVGLAALLVAIGTGLRGAIAAGDDAGPLGPATAVLLLIPLCVWFLTWQPGPEQGLVLGMAIAHASAAEGRRHRVDGVLVGSGRA